MIIHPNNPQVFQQIAEHLRGGELVAIPTETVYGLAADASNADAIKKIFTLKQRPMNNPLIVHVETREAMQVWGKNIPDYAWQLAKTFWPGPLTLIIPKANHVLNILTANQPSVGIRVPAHPIALAILQAFQGGLAAPSANPFMRVSPTESSHVENYFPEDLWIVEGGNATVGLESTIIDCTSKQPVLLRHGAITAEQILLDAGVELAETPSHLTTKHAGQHKRHYAPLTRLQLLDTEALIQFCTTLTRIEKEKTGLLLMNPTLNDPAFKKTKCLSHDPKAYGTELYRSLHELDASGCEQILVELPPHQKGWAAVRERLFKAAFPIKESSNISENA